jgi:type IX secretion system PorP/SprF family membrane protein
LKQIFKDILTIKYNNITKILFLFAFLGFIGEASAQQVPLFSQYLMNGFLLNPSVAGSDGYTSYNITAREQWVGLPRSPHTYSVSYQTRIMKSNFLIRKNSIFRKRKYVKGRAGRVGIGAYVMNDRNGIMDRTGVQFAYAYHIFIRKSQLSFGLSASIFQFQILKDGNSTTVFDPFLNGGVDRSIYVPDASFGVSLTHKDYYLGFSVSNLFQSPVKFGDNSLNNYKMFRNYFLSGAYKFPVNIDVDVEPSFMLKADELLVTQLDLGARLYLRNDYWFGVAYRTGNAIIATCGMKVQRFYVSYAFDYTLTAMSQHTYGSHEISLALKLGSPNRRFRWLNRY